MSDIAKTIAKTIAQQLGNRALMMLGAKNLLAVSGRDAIVGECPGLRMRIRGSQSVNMIEILLHPSDTYIVHCFKVRGDVVREVSEDRDVYVDNLHQIIESRTGLYTSI
jgi:hypothetical protein